MMTDGSASSPPPATVDGPPPLAAVAPGELSLLVPLVPAPAPGDLPSRFPSPFAHDGPHPLALRAARALLDELTQATGPLDAQDGGGPLVRLRLTEGKMFAVLVAEARGGTIGYLRAFSGMLEGRWRVPGFVPPLFDEAAREPWWTQAQAQLGRWQEELAELRVGTAALAQEDAWRALPSAPGTTYSSKSWR